jgi:hypothetical protein
LELELLGEKEQNQLDLSFGRATPALQLEFYGPQTPQFSLGATVRETKRQTVGLGRVESEICKQTPLQLTLEAVDNSQGSQRQTNRQALESWEFEALAFPEKSRVKREVVPEGPQRKFSVGINGVRGGDLCVSRKIFRSA